jgi:Domain of unknown function (DUF4062)/prokaryotic YEATS domain
MSHSVFVSSTFLDLKEHRETVQSAIRQLGAIDLSMENFGARDERPKAECLRIIADDAQSFVGIYAHRYGFVPKGDMKSITEAEYDAAAQNNLPRFIYLVNEEALWSPKFIDAGTNAKRLSNFKKRVSDTHICKRFSTKDDLATSVAADIGRHLLRQSLVRVSDPATGASATADSGALSTTAWNEHRYTRYKSSRDIFLVHALAPSKEPGQLFDIFVYLQRHKNKDFADVKSAEFFLGPYWENRVFEVVNKGSPMGIAVSAYGEFLCVCRVTFTDGSHVFLDRYINFSEYARDDG